MKRQAGRTRPAAISLVTFIATFAIVIYIFVDVQVLKSYPFHNLGVWGTQPLFLLTYSQTLELVAPVCLAAFASWQYAKSHLTVRRDRIVYSVGKTLFLSGALVGITVYVETHILWGELWYGLHFGTGLPGGGGYPWGDEQVAYNLCLIREPSYTSLTQNCYLLNYNGVLLLAIAALLIGGAITQYYRSGSISENS